MNDEASPNLNAPLPNRRKWWLAALTCALSSAAFFLPQRIPMEWYPLDEPGNDIHYLEIKCASDANGSITIWYDITHGWSDIDQIRFPISPTEQTYTYTFPLPDAPLIGLRLDPLANGGTLTVHHLRIINRRGEEIRNFTVESLNPIQQVAHVDALSPGWTITSQAGALEPIATLEPFSPILPVGISGRNFHRCLLSTGYLTGMLFILMLAVTSAFWRPQTWRDFFGHVILLVSIAVPISAVGNRGLFQNSLRYATFSPGDLKGPTILEIAVQGETTTATQLFWDTGGGFTEASSVRRAYVRAPHAQTLRYPLPDGPLRSLRFDPHDTTCTINIVKLEITDSYADRRIHIPCPGAFVPASELAAITNHDDHVTIAIKPNVVDPIVFFSESALTAINAANAELRSVK